MIHFPHLKIVKLYPHIKNCWMPWQSFTLTDKNHVAITKTEFLELVHTYSSIFDNLNFECRGKVHRDLSPIRKNDNACRT